MGDLTCKTPAIHTLCEIELRAHLGLAAADRRERLRGGVVVRDECVVRQDVVLAPANKSFINKYLYMCVYVCIYIHLYIYTYIYMYSCI